MSGDETAGLIANLLREHQPTTGMQVASGVTCKCGYWNGVEIPGHNRPAGFTGLLWHQAQVMADELVRLQRAENTVKAEALQLLELFVDDEECRWDHNHSCQTHGFFYLDQGEKCPMRAARDLLKLDDSAAALLAAPTEESNG